MRSRLVAFASLSCVFAGACGGAYGSLGMAEEGSGAEGTGESGEPAPDVPAEPTCEAQSLSVVFEMTLDQGPDSFGDAIAFEGDELLVGSVANGGPTLTKLDGGGGLLWKQAWPEFEAHVVRIDLDDTGASAIFAGLTDGNLTSLFDPEGETAFERMVPETGYDFHPAGVHLYHASTGPPFEPGPDELQVHRAAWRSYMDEPSEAVLDGYFNGGADVWDVVIQKPASMRVAASAATHLQNAGRPPSSPDTIKQLVVGTEGDAPWVAYEDLGDVVFDVVIDAGAPAGLTSIAVRPDDIAVLGGSCDGQGQRWGWLTSVDGLGAGLEDATGACQTWAPLKLPPVGALTVTDDGTTVVVSDDSDTLALVHLGQAPDLFSLSDLLGHDVEPRAIAAAGACDFVVTGRVESDGSSFVARLSGG